MRPSERGAGTVFTAIAVLVVVGVAVVGIWVTGWASTARRAQDAADLAAVAGAQVVVSGEDACTVARAAASRNGAELTSCSVAGEPPSFVVKVTVRMDLRPRVKGRGVPTEVEATAQAGAG